MMNRKLLIAIAVMLVSLVSVGQPCNTFISAYPYQEGFETNQGGWAVFGTSSDWVWGEPNKAVIAGAGEGSRCWFTGGFQANGYNNGEYAWLLSPCFDFSSLVNPEINFKIVWETEHRFDGANLQYSLDNGNNWTVLGDLQSGNSCVSTNWYNHPGITYLNNTRGWSGNIQPTSGSCQGGNGSGGWINASHTLRDLAGRSSVRFRFLFAAGTTCNNYDGFGVDDIRIAEAAPPSSTLTIESICINRNTVQFSVTGSCIQSYAWNFADINSGSNNTSSAISPSHAFSTPGIYNVEVMVTNANGTISTLNKEVVIIGAEKQINWPGACTNTPDATLTVIPTGSNTTYFYNWNTNPAQTTPAISNIGAGNYSVEISSMNACSITENFTLAASGNIEINPVVSNSVCGPGKGSVIITASGGTGPYTFIWSNNATTSAIMDLTAGDYSVTVTDANGCTKAGGPYTIINEDRQLNISLGADKEICPGESVTLSPGNFQNYLWQDGSINATFTTGTIGNYFVRVTDTDGCSGSDTIRVLAADCRDIFFPSAFTPNGDGLNELFGPLGNAGGLRQYSLQIYGRYGQLIFSTFDPIQKWDGSYKGKPMQTGNYIWISNYILGTQPQQKKGSLLLIR